MNYTADQYASIHIHDRNLIVIAGAGSGKTRVLVDRFVALLATHPDWALPSLVAITFTEKAAREMRDRVRIAIEAQIAESVDPAMIAFWRNHQAALDGARIGTIHSICTMLLRANAAHLGIDPGFEVLDEAAAAILRESALENALVAITQTDSARLFTVYEPLEIRSALRDLLRIDLTPRPPLREDGEGESDIMVAWRADYEATRAETLATLRADAELIAVLAWTPTPMPPDDDKLLPAWFVVQDLRRTLSASESESDDDLMAALRECQTNIKLNGGSAKNWGGKEGLADAKALLRGIRERAVVCLETIGEPPGELDALAAELMPAWTEALTLARAAYESAKAERRALDFADLETRARDLLTIEAVQARYRGTEFNHVLVDEFQDTNAAQRDIIYALTGLDRPGSLFVVGDPKQSIYAFRGADVSVFEQVRTEIVAAGGLEITLNATFRAHESLIGGVNAIFGRLLVKSSAYAVAYGEPLIANRASAPHHDPPLELTVLDTSGDGDKVLADDAHRWEARLLADRIRDLVARGWLVWDKAANDYRAAAYGDFAILFQSSNVMPAVEDAFKAAGLPYVTVAGKGYYSRAEVADLINLLRALYNPADDLALASVLRSPLYNISDDALYGLRLLHTMPPNPSPGFTSPPNPSPGFTSPPNPLSVMTERGSQTTKPIPLWEALLAERHPDQPDAEPLHFARASLARLAGLAGRVTIGELLTQALEETAYPATLTGLPDGARRVANVAKLLDLARTLGRAGRVSLGDFIAYLAELDELSDREAREGEAPVETGGAIQLMTVHASKGLEFPVVALFETSWGGRHDSPILRYDSHYGLIPKVRDNAGEWHQPAAYRRAAARDEDRLAVERLRLLYVAATRAQDRLLISGARGKTLKAGSWLDHLHTALDLDLNLDTLGESQLIPFAWGSLGYDAPTVQPDPVESIARTETAWDRLDMIHAAPYMPPLLAAPPSDPHAPIRTLTATEIGLLGEAHAQSPTGFAHFRQHILNDAPTVIRPAVTDTPGASVAPRIIGEIVHKALQWKHQPENLENDLRTYAWDQHITDEKQVDAAVIEAKALYDRALSSPTVHKLSEARSVYLELPFTFTWKKRLISGKIDVLYCDRFGKWTVLDYKTSAVDAEYVNWHARRYYIQLGIYAAAIEELTGQAPATYLYYIRSGAEVHVREADWRAALDGMEDILNAALTPEGSILEPPDS